MLKDTLRKRSKRHGFPSSHNKADLIEQFKTRIRIKVINRGRRRERNVSLEGASANNAIEIESDKDTTEHVFEDLEQSKNRDDPDELGMGSYLYDSPSAEEEPATNQVEANLERENPEAPTSLDDAGPSTSRT